MRKLLLFKAIAIVLIAVSASSPLSELDSEESRRASLRATIDTLRYKGSYEQALGLAEELLASLTADKNVWAYELGDAKRLVKFLEFAAQLPPSKQAELTLAHNQALEIADLYHRSRPDSAIPIARQQLRTRRDILGEPHREIANSLNNLAIMLDAVYEFADAERAYRAALSMRRQLLEEEHPNLAQSMDNLGGFLTSTGDYEEAEQLIRDALRIRRRLFDDRHPDVANSLNHLAILLRDTGDYDEALDRARESLDIQRELYGGTSSAWLVSLSLNTLGLLQQRVGQYAAAELSYREALAINRQLLGHEHDWVATNYNNLATLFETKGSYLEAEESYREAIAIGESLYGDDYLGTVSSLRGLGGILDRAKRQQNDAATYYEKALRIVRKHLDPPHIKIVSGLQDQAGLYHAAGRYNEAEDYYLQALEMMKQLGFEHQHELSNLRHNLAGLYQATGNLEEAAHNYRQALADGRKGFSEDHPVLISTMHGFASTLRKLNRLEDADSMYRSAIALAERHRTTVLGDETARAEFAETLNYADLTTEYASLLVSMGRIGDAMTVIESSRARAALDLLARPGFRDVSPGGQQESDMQDEVLDTARERRIALETAKARLRVIRNRPDLEAHAKREMIETQRTIIRDAKQKLWQVQVRVLEALQQDWPAATPKAPQDIVRALGADKQLVVYAWSSDYVLLLTGRNRDGEPSFEGYVLASSSTEVQALEEHILFVRDWMSAQPAAESRGKIGSLVDDSLNEAETEDSIRAMSMAAELFGRLVPRNARDAIMSSKRIILVPDGPLHLFPFEALVTRLGTEATQSRFHGAESTAPVHWLDVGPEIVYSPSGTMYLNRRARRQEQLRKGEPSSLRVLILADPVFNRAVPTPDYPESGVLITAVTDQSNAFRAGLRRGDVVVSYNRFEVADYVSLDLRIGEVEADIKEGRRVPEDSLDVSYWRDGTIARTKIATGRWGVFFSRGSPSEGLWRMSISETDDEESTARFFAREQKKLYGGMLKPLPGTAEEAERITEAVRAAGYTPVVLVQERARLSELEENLEGAAIIHLATHSLAGSVNRPYDANLALTQPVRPSLADFGYLRLEDIVAGWRGRLEHCSLVVLSACHTNVGVYLAGDALGLPLGFMYAGAPAVVASLWSVDDEITPDLMGMFYHEMLDENGDKMTAFTTARKRFKDRNPHPYYWAPFVLSGYPE